MGRLSGDFLRNFCFNTFDAQCCPEYETTCPQPLRCLCQALALSVSGPGALCVGPQRCLSSFSAALCVGPRPSGPGASLCRVPALSRPQRAPAALCRAPALSVSGPGTLRLSVSGPGTLRRSHVLGSGAFEAPAPPVLSSPALSVSGTSLSGPSPIWSAGPLLRSACHPCSPSPSLFPGENPKTLLFGGISKKLK